MHKILYVFNTIQFFNISFEKSNMDAIIVIAAIMQLIMINEKT